MGTYVFQLFRNFPYIHLQAEKNSGKTLAMNVISPISFNGKYFLDPTGPVIFREADINQPTMFLDETDTFANKKTVDRTIMSILNAGYTKGASVSRTSGRQIIDYTVYCPKMFGGIEELNDVLLSRSIQIKILRKLKEEKVERYIPNDATLQNQESIREDLYIFGLSYFQQIEKIYNEEIDKNQYLSEVSNRKFDVWAPLFVIAGIIDAEMGNTKLSESISKFMEKEISQQARQDMTDNITVRLLNTMEEILPKSKCKKQRNVEYEILMSYLTKEVHEEFLKEKDWRKDVPTTNKLTTLLKRIRINNNPEKIDEKTERCYTINLKEYKDICRRYGVISQFEPK